MNETYKKYLIEFNVNLIDQVNNVLKDVQIVRRTFSSSVSYLILISEEKVDTIINLLLIVTYNQIKIHDLNTEEDLPEVGTDKPLGSKSAIDEN